MPLTTSIIDTACARAQSQNLPYAGLPTPEEAWTLFQEHPSCVLIDVRTQAERDWVGRVPGAIGIEWIHYPGGVRNPDFMATLQQHATPNQIILLLCRSGVRSDAAARLATEAGYTQCFNIIGGFEGDKDAANQRNHLNGWRHAGLPWEQS